MNKGVTIFGFLSQFHYGSIKTSWYYIKKIKIRNSLNSTMVRLKHNTDTNGRGLGNSSQFHYGSINTNLESGLYHPPVGVSIPLWFD